MAASMCTIASRRLGQHKLVIGVCQHCMSTAAESQKPLYAGIGSLAQQFKKATEEKEKEKATTRSFFRTKEDIPANHSLRHEGLIYTIPKEDSVRLFSNRGLGTPLFNRLVKTFSETALMIRRPALEIIGYLKAADYDLPPVKYILYGNFGSGKTLSLAHVMHYCSTEKWMIVHAPWPAFWTKYFREIAMSTSHPGRIDLPRQATLWLKVFKQQNLPILKELDPKTFGRYVWSKREVTEEGSSWLDIIDHGINRVKYSSDCVGVILKELQHHSSKKAFRALVAIDGVNGLWADTWIKDEERKLIPPEQVSLIHHFKKLFKGDWTNGAIVSTVDKNANQAELRGSDLPRYLLQKEGFEWMDPFIPVSVANYSEKEIHSCIEYYLDRKWIQNPKGNTEEGKRELIFLSGNSPHNLNIVASNW